MKDLSKIEELYHLALEHSPDEREAFLKQTCGNDLDLLREVESLLASYEEAGAFFEQSPEDVAADFFANFKERDLIGKEFSHYQILSRLGQGGMGEVYLAEDIELGRRIALKLLPTQFSSDAERKIRFEQEARAVSALNHPNIITIHGIEKSEEFNFIATEYIEGQTLKEKIAHEKISWSETVNIGIQIASALESAHSVGIIHRDIKPANLMLRQDGIVKVLDFGLAKLVESEEQWGVGSRELGVGSRESGNEEKRRVRSEEKRTKADKISTLELAGYSSLPTPDSRLPTNLTDFGTVMGTINYMSPEQALGEKVDHRTDIFSLGVVLYEMLSGLQPFRGDTVETIYHETINQIPISLTKLNPEIPAALNRIVLRALEKSREARYQTVAELRAELQKLKENPDFSASHLITSQRTSSFLKILLPATALGSLILAGIYFIFVRPAANQPSEAKITNYTQLTSQKGEELFPNLSPDGRKFVYSSLENGNWDIYSQTIGEATSVNLTQDSPVTDKQSVFSPDGEQIAFRSERDGGGIFVMSQSGENIRRISETGFYPNWSPDGKEIVFCEYDFIDPTERFFFPSLLWSVNISNGQKRQITEIDAVQPSWSPNGERIAFWGIDSGGIRDIKTISANGGEIVSVTNDSAIDWNPVWSPDGKYLYFTSNRGGSMNFWRVAIDEKSGKTLGDPEQFTTPSVFSRHLTFAADGGNFAYVQTTNSSNLMQAEFNPQTLKMTGKKTEITNVGGRIDRNPSASPDGEWIAFDAIKDKQTDLFIIRRDGTELRQLTNDPARERAPRWSPDGKKLIFYSNRAGNLETWTINTDGSGLKQLSFNTEPSALLAFWSPDGSKIVQNLNQVYPKIYDAGQSFAAQTPFQIPSEASPNQWIMAFSWSPDGNKIASGRVGNPDIEGIVIYSIRENKSQNMTDFGEEPVWLNDNRHLIFLKGNEIYLLDSQTSQTKNLMTTADNEKIQGITISPDNRSIYYSLQKSESDIWLANIQ